MKSKWYLQTWFISIVFAFSILLVPLIVGLILLVLQYKQSRSEKAQFDNLRNDHAQLVGDYNRLKGAYDNLREHVDRLNLSNVMEVDNKLTSLNEEFSVVQNNLNILKLDYEQQLDLSNSLTKKIKTAENKLRKSKELYKAIDYSIKKYFIHPAQHYDINIISSDLNEADRLAPGVSMHLHSMDLKELKKAFNENNKLIEQTLKEYDSRYTTKANKSIYSLMVISLRAELQNVLSNLKYGKLEDSIDLIKNISQKYQVIAADGNQSIAGTITRFIGEIEYLFINAVKIEYNYYVKKQQAKEEQAAIRQQMKEEAAERRELKKQRERIEQEELKYNNELESLKSQLEGADENTIDLLNSRILELQAQLSDVLVKKDEITTLQNGKAGNVYIISNLGSFGDQMFKIGMTRRINPEERVNELGSASVPFKFDVHSFIFSNDAVGLETKLHQRLNSKRVNKVNPRKEFFNVSIDELEDIVLDEDPTAEFIKTMAAEEYYQSISSEFNSDDDNTNDINNYEDIFDDDDDDDLNDSETELI